MLLPDLFSKALQLSSPWKIVDAKLIGDTKDLVNMELHLYIDFEKGSKFSYEDENGNILIDENGNEMKFPVYDTDKKEWRHLNFFLFKTYIHARVPRIKLNNGKVKQISVPWARKGSGFTLFFESVIILLSQHMSVLEIAKMVDEHDTRLWYFLKHYIKEARKNEDYSDVSSIGIDETSKKGHNYISVVADIEKKK